MTILQALAGQYERLMGEEDIQKRPPPYGFSSEKISYAIVLSQKGEVIDIQPLLDTTGETPRPSLRSVPQAVIRASGITSNFLWDKTAYVFGAKGDKDNHRIISAEKEHESFRKLHFMLLQDVEDEGLSVFLKFLENWRHEQFQEISQADEILDTNVVFRLDKELQFLHERKAATTVWLNHIGEAATQAGPSKTCLVTGENAPSARLHSKIKGVRGAQSSGASIVSFNLDAFSSYGKLQGDNAPVSNRAASAYVTALNHMLAANSRQRVQIGDTTTVFWAEAEEKADTATKAENLFSMILEPAVTDESEAGQISKKLEAIAKGRPLSEVDPGVDENTRFFVLGLAPNASRLSIRFWFEDNLGNLSAKIGKHWQDLSLEPTPWKTPPALWRLLRETAVQNKLENIPPAIGGALMRSILTGSRYPQSLLGAVIARIRADKNINGTRAAICKACLTRDYRLGFAKEDVPMSLHTEENNTAYRLGRLFAVYEDIQRAAVNPKSTIRARYFGAASATPASVFPILVRNSMHHLATIRKGERGGRAHRFEREVGSILDGMETSFPRSLRLEDQGRFAIGYYQQKSMKKNASQENEGSQASGDAEFNDED